MSPIVRLALEALQDPENSPGVRSVAATTLLVALGEDIEVPGCHFAVWRFLLASDASSALLHRYEIAHPDVAADAVRVIRDRDAGENVRDLAVAVLKGDNLGVVTEDDLVTIADRVFDEGRSRQFAWLVERVH